MGCFSGHLMSPASDQKLFCELCSPFCCYFNEFVEEKVVSPSYSSAILAPPPYFSNEETNTEGWRDLHELTQSARASAAGHTEAGWFQVRWRHSVSWSRGTLLLNFSLILP